MLYEVKAYRAAEGVVVLRYDATETADAMQRAEAQGYRVISAKSKSAWRISRGHHFPLALFSQELLSLLGAGLPLLESLEALSARDEGAETGRVYREMIRLLREGQPLSQTLQQFPAAFPPLFVATVRAAERTGDLKKALGRYLAYQTQLDAVRKKVATAALYPALLLVVGGLVTAFLLAYVVPRFAHIYEDMGERVPLLSKLLMEWGRLIDAHGAAIGAALLFALGAGGYWAARPETHARMGRFLARIPAVGRRLKTYHLARFYRTVGMLLQGGIPLVTALEMAQGLLGPGMREGLTRAAQAIREGRPASDALKAQELTTEVAQRMLRVGERSGSLGEMMEQIALFHDEDTARWLDWFARLFEPLLMVVIGLVIGIIVLLMYLPIFELAGSIQ